jgi:hypothetical protein
MSSITVTHKTLSILDNRNVSLIILAALVAVLVTIVAVVAASPAAEPFDHNAYRLYRQGEWVSPPLSSAVAYQIFRRDEVTSPVNPAEAYRIFRLGEWAGANPVDLSAYRQSEHTLVNPNAGLSIYQLSERTLVNPLAGMAIYHSSERTRVPMRLNEYQRSEWFGE